MNEYTEFLQNCINTANIYIKADEKLDNKMSKLLNIIQNTNDEISKVCMDYLKTFLEKYNKVKKSALIYDRRILTKFEEVGLAGLTASEKWYFNTLVVNNPDEVLNYQQYETIKEELYQKLIKTIPDYENHD